MTSREISLAAALRAASRSIPLQDVLAEMFTASELSPRDRAFAEEVAFGSLRRRITLDLVLDHVLTQPITRVQAPVAEALRQAAYQMLVLDRVPPHAAVNETVTLVKAQMGKGPAGLTNAVLRAVNRLIRKKGADRPKGGDSRKVIASRDGRFTSLGARVLPGIDENLTRWLAGAYGYPEWMVDRWFDSYGAEGAEDMLKWGNATPGLSVRLNPRRAGEWPLSDDEAAKVFESCSEHTRGEVAGTYSIAAQVHPGELPGFKLGEFTVQDQTQTRPARVLAPAEGDRVLDLCAGRGGKSVQLAEIVGTAGHVTALEKSDADLELARRAQQRLGLDNITFVEGDCLAAPEVIGGDYTHVLLDAPCSNLGSLDRRPEVRYRVKPDTLKRLAADELKLLAAASKFVAGGGTLVYSVCTLEPEETSGVVNRFIESATEFALIGEHRVLPAAGYRDGGYCASLRRTGGDA